jgi:hypothetical protein
VYYNSRLKGKNLLVKLCKNELSAGLPVTVEKISAYGGIVTQDAKLLSDRTAVSHFRIIGRDFGFTGSGCGRFWRIYRRRSKGTGFIKAGFCNEGRDGPVPSASDGESC